MSLFGPPRFKIGFRAGLYLITREEDFRRPLRDASDLIDSYEAVSRAGSRPRPALARGAIVLSLSGWQAFVEVLATTMLMELEPREPKASTPEQRAEYLRDYRYWQLRRGEVTKGVADFSTPSSQNCRNLLLRLGFDPWPEWTIRDGTEQLSPLQTRTRLDEWLLVRHALAHGNRLPDVSVLDRTRAGSPMVGRRAAERCLRFVRTLISATHDLFFPESLRHDWS